MSAITKDDVRTYDSKVPEVSLAFWVIKIAATTLGETAGDAVSMSMNLATLLAQPSSPCSFWLRCSCR